MSDQEPSKRLVFPFMKPVYDGLADYAYPLLRVTAGLIYVPHGYQKLFGGRFDGTAAFFTKMGLPAPEALTAYVGISEFFGGIAIALGLLTRPFAAMAAVNLFVGAFLVHWGSGFFWTGRGYEYPLLWALVMVVIFIRGGHHMSLDKRMSWEL